MAMPLRTHTVGERVPGGRLRIDHIAGTFPSEQADTLTADRALLDSLSGRKHIGIMERRGKTVVNDFNSEV